MKVSELLSSPLRRWTFWRPNVTRYYTILGFGSLISGTATSVISYTKNVNRLGVCIGIALCTAGSLALVEAYFGMLQQKQKNEDIRRLRYRRPEFYGYLRKYLEMEMGETLSDEQVDEAAVDILYHVSSTLGRRINNEPRLYDYVTQYLKEKIKILERHQRAENAEDSTPETSSIREVTIYDIATNLRGLSGSPEWYFRGFIERDPNQLVPTPDSDVNRYMELVNKEPEVTESVLGTSLLSRQIEEMDRQEALKSRSEEQTPERPSPPGNDGNDSESGVSTDELCFHLDPNQPERSIEGSNELDTDSGSPTLRLDSAEAAEM